METNLVILPSPSTSEERIRLQIERFRKEMIGGDVSTDVAEELLSIIIEYLGQFESDPFLEQAFVKLNESFFWLSSFNSDI